MTIEPVDVGSFAAFFEEVRGRQPFPWQRRLAEQVCRTGVWPDMLDLPTASGKTAVLDIAVFAMAVDAARPAAERKMPRRAILVVDRRTIVDQAHTHARTLARALRQPAPGSMLERVAVALDGLRGDVSWPRRARDGRRPLAVAYLRGAIPRDDGWARDPSQPFLGVSTVDQIGSRLLFRGYGVSTGMRSVHAGLLGNDVVYFLDEVHLSQPFARTLDAVRRWRRCADQAVPATLSLVAMSATADAEAGARFALDADDRGPDALGPRLSASKPTTLQIVKVAGDEARRREIFADALAELAEAAVSERHRRIAIVINRVDTALAVHERLARTHGKPRELVLVTGRMRPIDREAHEQLLSDLRPGERDPRNERLAFVVATQCIEAGADLDFDVLVTECASRDAVIQRFGRLDRIGAHRAAQGFIAIRSDHVDDATDPVYGPARSATWRWLNERAAAGGLDFGLTSALHTERPPGTQRTPARAPVLLPSHLDVWSQTQPAPEPEPDLALWLHGVVPTTPEVSVIWRADLVADAETLAPLDLEMLSVIFDASPPLRQEALSIPLWAAEAWLREQPVDGVSDVEGALGEEEASRTGVPARRWALRWKGDGEIELIQDRGRAEPLSLRAGDTIVVPTAYGGLRAGTWAPTSPDPITDLGDEAQLRQRARLVIRVDALAGTPLDPDPAPEATRWRDDVRAHAAALIAARDESGDDEAALAALVALLGRSPAPAWLRDTLPAAGALDPQYAESPNDTRTSVILVARRRVSTDPGGEFPEVSSEDDRASLTGVAVSLSDHLAHVAEQAEAFTRSHGLPEGLARDVVLAARWHDIGKVDPRFQLWLAGGDEVAHAMLVEPLAKSRMERGDRRRREAARQRAGYPRGARHELASVALLERCESVLARASDRDLVLHLIASHHGWCRPFAPIEAPGEPVDVTWSHEGVALAASSAHGLAGFSAPIAERFWRLTARYGWWGLAWLETLVRLADHRASRDEQREGGRR